jgi:membrane associated rhomboid family serine protease
MTTHRYNVILGADCDFSNKILLLLYISMKIKIDLKSSVFWGVISCNLVKVNQHFGGTCRVLLEGRTVSQKRNQFCSRRSLLAGFLLSLLFSPEDGGNIFP